MTTSPQQALYERNIRAARRDILFSPLPKGEACSIHVKPKFPTACWSWLPPHRIFIGDGIVDKALPKLAAADLDYYIQSYLHHEWAHKSITERNLVQIREDLARRKVPFALFNLFEDARIEEWYRQTTGRAFRWAELEALTLTATPGSLLFLLIQTENNLDLALRHMPEPTVPPDFIGPLPDPQVLLREIWHAFYQPMLAAATSQALYPLLEAWLARFPPEPYPPTRGNEGGEAGGEGGAGDLDTSAQLQADSKLAASFLAGSAEVPEESAKPKTAQTYGRGEKLPDNHVAEAANGEVLSTHSQPVDCQRVQRLLPQFRKLFSQKVRWVSTSDPTKRLSLKHHVLGRPPFRRRELLGRRTQRVTLIVDCSGSMNGFHIAEARVLVEALSALARERMVSGHVLLSIVTGNRARWQRFALPLALDLCERIDAYGSAEGLEYTMTANAALLGQSDYVLVYTDAAICDKPIDKARWHRQRVYTWGLYAGSTEEEQRDALLKYFDKAIVRNSVEHLVDAMLAAH